MRGEVTRQIISKTKHFQSEAGESREETQVKGKQQAAEGGAGGRKKASGDLSLLPAPREFLCGRKRITN